MNCNEVKSRLLDLVYDELPSNDAAECRRHASQCSACGAELAALESTGRALATLPERRTRVDLARLCLAVTVQSRDARRRGRRWYFGTAGLAAAAAALLFALVRVEVAPGQLVVAWRARAEQREPDAPGKPRESDREGTLMSPQLVNNDNSNPRAGLTGQASFAALARVPPISTNDPYNYLRVRDVVLARGLEALPAPGGRQADAAPVDPLDSGYGNLRREFLNAPSATRPGGDDRGA